MVTEVTVDGMWKCAECKQGGCVGYHRNKRDWGCGMGGLWALRVKQHMETAVARQLCFGMYSLYNYNIN